MDKTIIPRFVTEALPYCCPEDRREDWVVQQGRRDWGRDPGAGHSGTLWSLERRERRGEGGLSWEPAPPPRSYSSWPTPRVGPGTSRGPTPTPPWCSPGSSPAASPPGCPCRWWRSSSSESDFYPPDILIKPLRSRRHGGITDAIKTQCKTRNLFMLA